MKTITYDDALWQLVPKRLNDSMIESAMQAHYGKNIVGARGMDMSVNGLNYDGAQAMRLFWKGALAVAPSPPTLHSIVDQHIAAVEVLRDQRHERRRADQPVADEQRGGFDRRQRSDKLKD